MTVDNWHARAACRKPWVDRNWFFPQDTDDDTDDDGERLYGVRKQDYGDDGLRARLICASCPVFANCWKENRDAPTGIFAGTDEIERARMYSRQRARLARTTGTGAGLNWNDVPVPDLRPVHVASPSVPVQIALYAFLHGKTIQEATEVGEVKEGLLRRAVSERRRAS